MSMHKVADIEPFDGSRTASLWADERRLELRATWGDGTAHEWVIPWHVIRDLVADDIRRKRITLLEAADADMILGPEDLELVASVDACDFDEVAGALEALEIRLNALEMRR